MDVSVEPVSSLCFKSGLFYLLLYWFSTCYYDVNGGRVRYSLFILSNMGQVFLKNQTHPKYNEIFYRYIQ